MRFLLLPLLPLLLAAKDPPPFQISHPWARATAPAAKNGAVYLTITDQGAPDQLIGASATASESASLHQTINDNGVMKMRLVESLPLAAGKTVTMSPGGYHIMLVGLKTQLRVGDSFPLTLRFANASPLTVTVQIEAGADTMHH